MKTRREYIESTIDDLVGSFLYYDRKEDEELPRGEIEEAVKAGEITSEEIVKRFRKGIFEHFGAVTHGPMMKLAAETMGAYVQGRLSEKSFIDQLFLPVRSYKK